MMPAIIGWGLFGILAYGFYNNHHKESSIDEELDVLTQNGMTKSQAKQMIMREYEILGYTSGEKMFKQ